jgi:hypothetical protein
MSKSSAKTFGRGSAEIVQRVVDTARIELWMQAHDFVGPAPDSLVGDEPRPLGLVQLGRERIHDRIM